MRSGRDNWRATSRSLPGRCRRLVCAAVATLLAVSSVAVVSAPAGGQESGGDVVVRIVARKVADGRVEVGLQQRLDDATWSEQVLPPRRFFPTTATVGRWLVTWPTTTRDGDVVVRIVARKVADGRVEVGLQQRLDDATWSPRMLLPRRFFPTTATVGRWLGGSPLAAAWPDVVPTDPEWEPATILTFEGEARQSVPVYDGPEGERVTFQDGDRPSAAWMHVPLPLVVRVVQGSEGDEWAEVELPVRPNGSRGWIRTDGFAWSTVDHHIFVDLSDRSLALFHGDDLIVHTPVIVGKPSTPTPVTTGFIIGKLPNHDQQFASIVLDAWILPVSFFSEVLNSFGGFPPRVSLHGTHIPERVGEALSNFEVRIPNEIVEVIAREAPIGTTVRIVE